jgi:hypothetical protein
MGIMRFLMPQRTRLPDETFEQSYVAGYDLIPLPAHMSWEDEQILRVERNIDDSGALHIPWRVDGHGDLLLSTASLMERERPYLLPLEIARGTVHRLRTKADVWRSAGLQLSAELAGQIRAASAKFTRAAMTQADPAAAAVTAEEAVRLSLDASRTLGDEYAQQVLAVRHKDNARLPTLLGGNLGQTLMPSEAQPMFGAAFNTALAPLAWRQVQPAEDQWQWTLCDKQLQLCAQHGLRVIGGPLCQLDTEFLPDWVRTSDGSFDMLLRSFRQYVAAVVQRYRGQVHLWHCAARMNRSGELPLDDEERVRLTVCAIETTRRVDPRTSVIVGVDQPWGEYMTDEPSALTPWQFAEMLVRADLGVAGLALELNLGYWPGGTLPRDILDFSDLFDFWGLFGLPLILQITVPSSDEPDEQAHPQAGRVAAAPPGDRWTPPVQKEFVARLLSLLLAKQNVSAVIWNQVFDAVPHRYAWGGVFDGRGLPKPVLSALIAARRDHLE